MTRESSSVKVKMYNDEVLDKLEVTDKAKIIRQAVYQSKLMY